MSHRRRALALAALAALAAWLGYRRLAGSGSGETPAPAPMATELAAPAPRYRYHEGRWVRDQGDVSRLLRDLGRRPAGLIRVAGTVRDDDSDQPVAGAEVVFASPAGEASAHTDLEGRYELHLAPSSYRAFARADGYVAVGAAPPPRIPGRPEASEVGVPRDDLAPLVHLAADQDALDLHVRGAAEIVGTVFDGSGRPVEGAVVVARLNQIDGIAIPRALVGTDVAETDLNGAYRLVVPAGMVRLEASHAEYAAAASSFDATRVVAAGETERIDLTLAAGCIITGTAVDADGYRVAEGALEIYIGGEPPNDFAPVGRLDERGEFRLAVTQTGEVRLRAWPWKSAPARPQSFDCSDGARYRGVTFVAPRAEPDLSGHIVSADGQPVAHAFVDVFPLSPGGMAQQERADGRGEWAVFALPAGEYQVTAYVPGLGATATRVTVPDQRVELRLGGTGTLAGTVEGIEYGSFTLTVDQCGFEHDDGPALMRDAVSMPATVMMVPVVGGEFRVEGVPACPLVARARAGTREVVFETTVPAGDQAVVTLDLRVPVRKTVQGIVTHADGTAAAGAMVVASGGGRRQRAHADAEGRYEVQAWGGQTLMVCAHDTGCTGAEVSMTAEPVERIDLTLP